MLQITVKEIPRYKQQDVLEGGKQCDQLHGPLSTVPGPYDEYLGRVRDEGDQTQDEADNYPSQDIVHPLPVVVVVQRWWGSSAGGRLFRRPSHPRKNRAKASSCFPERDSVSDEYSPLGCSALLNRARL